ncbi:MAG: hypothetical protein LBK82_04225 [Planctomycetaceae bacterium]|nr:hypothetical protein [Planctomycetaceae bacterium]
MSTHQYKQFSDLSSLRRFHFDLLYQFLLPFKDYLCSQHHFRWTDDLLRFPYQDLANILAEPDEELPELLHNGIFFIDELSTPQAAEFIVQQLKDEDQTIPSWINQSNLALYSWLLNPGILQAIHPQLAALRPRRFEKSYSLRSALPDLSKERIIALEDELNNWFDSLNKGRGVPAMHYQRNGIISFYLRHGELYKRDIALKNNGQTRRVVYRHRNGMSIWRRSVKWLKRICRYSFKRKHRNIYLPNAVHGFFGMEIWKQLLRVICLDPLLFNFCYNIQTKNFMLKSCGFS